MRGGHAQCAGRRTGVVAREFFQVVDLLHDPFGRQQDLLPGRGQSEDAFALAREDRNAEFAFELDDRLRHARLRRMQRARGRGDVEFVTRRLAQEAELLQIHGAAASLSNVTVRPGGKYRDVTRLPDF